MPYSFAQQTDAIESRRLPTMANTLDAGALEQRARQLLDSRITAVRNLVTARQAVTDLQAKLAEAEREDARLYQAALRDGWTTDELRQLGLTEPAKKERVRRRQAASRPAAQAPATPAEDGV